jgi:uncharacterized protein YbaR (Trm112 family)
MQEDLLQVLCCPSCKGDLKLDVKRKQREEVVEGTLTCKSCAAVYPIEQSVPNLLPLTEEEGPQAISSKEVKAHG